MTKYQKMSALLEVRDPSYPINIISEGLQYRRHSWWVFICVPLQDAWRCIRKAFVGPKNPWPKYRRHPWWVFIRVPLQDGDASGKSSGRKNPWPKKGVNSGGLDSLNRNSASISGTSAGREA